MEEKNSTPLKRQREEENKNEESLKHQKSMKEIISLFEEDEEDPNQDLSSLISTLQQELSSGLAPDPENTVGSSEEDVEKVMRHLLEASDDELGIPSSDVTEEGHVDGGDLLFAFGGEGIWEFEENIEDAHYCSNFLTF